MGQQGGGVGQPGGGVGQPGGRGGSAGGRGGSAGGEGWVSMAGSMPLAFMQEDFLFQIGVTQFSQLLKMMKNYTFFTPIL